MDPRFSGDDRLIQFNTVLLQIKEIGVYTFLHDEDRYFYIRADLHAA